MRSIFGLNYFVFCITALILILYCTKDMRDEGFGMSPGTLVQLTTSHVPSSSDINEYFDSTGALINLATTRAPSRAGVREFFGMAPGVIDDMAADSTGGAYGMFPELESFAGFDNFPQLEYSTSVNKVDRKIDKQIYDNLTIQGMNRMSPESKYVPYHCPKGLME